jgi:hypothetical protein
LLKEKREEKRRLKAAEREALHPPLRPGVAQERPQSARAMVQS